MALFGRNASKRGSCLAICSHEAGCRVKGADLAPPSPTLLLTKQALRDIVERGTAKGPQRLWRGAYRGDLLTGVGRYRTERRELGKEVPEIEKAREVSARG